MWNTAPAKNLRAPPGTTRPQTRTAGNRLAAGDLGCLP